MQPPELCVAPAGVQALLTNASIQLLVILLSPQQYGWVLQHTEPMLRSNPKVLMQMHHVAVHHLHVQIQQ